MSEPTTTLELPKWLDVEALKRRIDKRLSGDDKLLEEYLVAAFEQIQEPSPLGCGRLLLPDPEPDLDGEGKDTTDPVERVIRVTNRRVILPDAREVASVVDTTDPDNHSTLEGWTLRKRNGVFVQLRLSRTTLETWSSFGWGPSAWWEDRPGRTEPESERELTITGRFGFTEIPWSLREAIYVLAARKYFERQARYSDSVRAGEGQIAQVYYKDLPAPARLAIEAFLLPPAYSGLA